MTKLLNEDIKLLEKYKARRETDGFDDDFLAELEKDNLVKISYEPPLKMAEITFAGKDLLGKIPSP